MGLVVGIDASRNRSGGAKAHLAGLLTENDPQKHGIDQIHVWAFQSLLKSIPDRSWLIKHAPIELEQSLVRQLWWQATRLSGELADAGCDILFTTDASTLCRFSPMIVMSQDMLSYEPGVMKSYGFTRARLRLIAILLLQNRAFRSADGVIFLSRYAAQVIQRSCGRLPRIAYIPHGIGKAFKYIHAGHRWPSEDERPINCLYVSNTALYKNQWVVVQATKMLRARGHNVTLTLAGGGRGKAQEQLERQVAASDPQGTFVRQLDFVPHDQVPDLLACADLFVFASSCENLPVTLLEAMAAGLPIACSDRGPMPEILEDAGVYFDPLSADSVANAVERIIKDAHLRTRIARRAKFLAEQYSWSRCSDETWAFIAATHKTTSA